MKRFTSAGILAMGAVLVSQVAQAQFTPNHLYAGFVSPSATSDYLIDLGSASTITGAGSVVDLSAHFNLTTFVSTFNLLGGGSITNVSMGVVGGESQFFPSIHDLYATSLRVGGAGNPTVPGSDLSPFTHSQSVISSATSDLSGVAFPNGGGTADASKSWTANVAPNLNSGTFYGATGINPDSAFNSSGVLYEDLWSATPSSAYTYQGYFTMNPSQSTLTFTPVPEPGVFSVFACGGALLLWRFRWRQANRKSYRS